jgi:TetR/AcrR family transcriptional regulator
MILSIIRLKLSSEWSAIVGAMATQRSRRSPAGAERKRDPERTREKILEAAVVEFGEHGYAGARISAIAGRAGVNQQLISYYFDGKAGLYRALTDRWRAISADVDAAGLPLTEVVGEYVRLSAEQRSWSRLLVWSSLTGEDGESDGTDDGFFQHMVDDLRARQAAGEVAADLDPAYLMVILFAAALAPTVVPQVARAMTGEAADSEAFLDRYRAELGKVLTHLSGGGARPGPPASAGPAASPPPR